MNPGISIKRTCRKCGTEYLCHAHPGLKPTGIRVRVVK
jgi:hypothetical protein